MAEGTRFGITRRRLLIGGGAGVGLAVAWAVWPRHYVHNLSAAEGESIFNAFLKIGEDGHISVVVPQAEMGQGVWTALPQALADELGADWRTVGVEPAPINPLYTNDFIFTENAEGRLPSFLGGVGRWGAREYAVRNALMMTGGSTSIRGFEQRFREAGAAARAALCMAAADRWDVEWDQCETADGFVTHGDRRLRFGDLAVEAAAKEPPSEIALFDPARRPITGQSMPRIDLPSKVDGSARYAGDVRLPGMVFASTKQAPTRQHRLKAVNRAAANNVFGVMTIFENPRFVACVGTNWWAANQGVEALAAEWESDADPVDDASIDAALEAALDGDGGERIFEQGNLEEAFAGTSPLGLRAVYSVGLAPHAQIEPLTATARSQGGKMEIWAPTQAQGLMRDAVARAIDYDPGDIVIYPMLLGGAFGRKVENDAAVQAAIIARRLNRPVQLTWSREEETRSDYYRPAALGRLTGRVGGGGRISVLHTRIAVPAAGNQLAARIMPSFASGGDEPDAGAVEGAVPAYAIPNLAVEHMPADIGVECGIWRSVAHSYTAFFTECFVDELAIKANMEPLSFRMGMLGDQPRLARCLTQAAMLGGWDGGEQGGGMGLAAHSCFGSHVAMMVALHIGDDQRPVIDRVAAAVDCGRVINPEIVKQQIEGGIIFGMSAALGGHVEFADGEPISQNFDGLSLPLLADTPEIGITIVESDEEPGGVGEIAVPPVAPAIGNAIFAATGQRLRKLPFVIGGTA
ncbi:molybdopterin cofactor-binding domain-containing protein [uncultured Parasphingopyxis sp.]|uniref:xanthine dehydrogenase family protein molybdopterin-binding subunit n=2 Tax=Parasphingopyxis TaxID=1234545 RepID=UPI00260F1895|nr:molybdopterin cofactor-binding domain-containing protein [uncultured Parasphingopyxis sp.]